MSTSGKTSTSTSLKCKATIDDEQEDHDSFTGAHYSTDLDVQHKVRIKIYTEIDAQRRFQEISLYIPKDGNVTDKTYNITQHFNNPSDANAIWSKSNSSAQVNYTATEGSLTLTFNNDTKTVKATFNFKGTNMGKKVSVSEGVLELDGFTENSKNDVESAVACDLSRDVVARYKSRETDLRSNSNNQIVGWSRAFSSEPNLYDYRIAILFSIDLPTGVYNISADSKKVTIIFFHASGSYIYEGESGQLTVTSLPTIDGDNNPTGTFAGTFNFVAGATDSSGVRHFTEAQNGVFSITN
ncbi:hypothetical protein CI807_25530 [Pseudomonas sp. NS1(2017)]|uniref:hypothetical protein n=1 Tax=Pseudomonas sp. NS1(2017) TaxID=2025658 RepID=UPI000BA23423|nr:hypothetical protein [Pseudomonas sp. NS1(2017)]ASV39426.1 hypothetical protein CI807_25530 [Pseudomonas sp. NS1(2017)]